MSTSPQIPLATSQMAKERLRRHHPSTDDVLPGTFFDDPNYFDSMPWDAKVLACAVHAAGYGTNPSEACHHYAKRFFQSFRQNNDPEYLLSSMAVEAMAMRWMSAEQLERGEFNDLMGTLYYHKFDSLSNDPTDLNQAIRHAKLSKPYFEGDRETLSRISMCLSDLHMRRYQLLLNDSDFDKVKEYLEQAIDLTGSIVCQLQITIRRIDLVKEAVRKRQAQTEAYMSEVLVLLDSLLLEPPSNLTPQFGEICQAAGEGCMLLNREFENVIWIERSISYLAKSIVLFAGSSSSRHSPEEQLSQARQLRNRIQRDSQGSDPALITTQNLIKDQPQVLEFRVQLAEVYREEGLNATESQLRRKGLDDAVNLMEDVVSIMPTSFYKRGWAHDRCSAAYFSRFDAYKIDEDINEAIIQSMKASNMVENEYTWTFCHLLSQYLLERFEKHRNPEDLKAASTSIEKAATRTTNSPTAQAECKWIIGKIRRKEYSISPADETLAEGIDALETATRSLPEPSVSRALALHDLGNAYLTLYTHDPKPENWGKCIHSLQESVRSLSGAGGATCLDAEHPNMSMLNSSLGGAMLQRFRQVHIEQDLESSIQYFKRALNALDPLDARYAPRAGNLCQALRELFELRGERADLVLLDEGQDIVSSALSNPEILGGPIRSWLEGQLGDLFSVSYQRTKLPSDKENAVKHYDNALGLPDVPSGVKALTMTNKAVLLKRVAENTGLEEDFNSSYSAFHESAQMYPGNDPNAWLNTYNYANLAHTMHERMPGDEDHTYGIVSLENYKTVAEDPAVPVRHRITAASLAASLAYSVQNDSEAARDLISICLALLPKFSLLHARRAEQLEILRENHYVPSGAAALSISAGDPVSLAIQRLESGRANINDRLMDQKTQLEFLAEVEEPLANRFQELQLRLSPLTMSGVRSMKEMGSTFVNPNDQRRLQRERDARDYQDLSGEIRRLGLALEFMDPFNDTGQLQKLADDAPIVFINASDYRSDAFIITKDKDPFNLHLPDFNVEAIKSHALTLLVAEDMYSSGADEAIAKAFADYKSVMKWLWESAAKPVIHSIDFSNYARGPTAKPRLIWVTTGWIPVFPIHAAGDFISAGGSNESSVHDRVVSSYTLSLKALGFSKRKAHGMTSEISEDDTALVVGMESTPGMTNGNLNINPEIASIEDELKGCMKVEVKLQKGFSEIKNRLECSTITHFACHGLLNPEDPSLSALLLQDCANEGQLKSLQPFCVWKIISMQMRKCGLAYLSACESGASRDLLLRDEGLHIAGAFHMAGVPHVVSTLWKVRDTICADITRHFYRNLRNERGKIDFYRSADALHIAIQKLRDQGEEPMLWGPFIHSGF